MSNSLQPHELQHTRPPCPSPTPGVHPNPCPLSWRCRPAISSSVVPFSSCPQSFPASGSFPMSQLFASGGQRIAVAASASVLPMNTLPRIGVYSTILSWSRLCVSRCVLVVKNPLANAGDIRDTGLLPGLGRSPGEGNGKSLQYSGLEYPMDRGAWQPTVHRVAKSRTRMKQLSTQPFFPESLLYARHCDEHWYWKLTKTLLLTWKGSQPCESGGCISVESIHLFV